MQKKRYQVRATQVFDENLRKLVRKNTELRDRLKSRISELELDPYAGTIPLAGRYQGWRKDRVQDYRIILAVCEECKGVRNPKLPRCVECEEMESNTIKLIEVGHRDKFWDQPVI